MRTGEGRLAKCRAWRDLNAGLALHLDWVTYDNPIPRLDIAALWSVAERGPVDEYISADCSRCRTSEVAWCGRFEAWPRLMAFPIDYQWCLCGTILDEGDGEVDSPHGPIAYSLSGRHLRIRGELGQSIECELCVSAIDHRNAGSSRASASRSQGVRKLYACRVGRDPVTRSPSPSRTAPWPDGGRRSR